MAKRVEGQAWFWLEHVSAQVAASRLRVGNLIDEAQVQELVRKAERRDRFHFSNFRPVTLWKVPTARPPREGAISAFSSLVFSEVVVSPRMKDELWSLIGDQVQFLEVALKRPVVAKWARAADETVKSVFVMVPLIQLECIDWKATQWKRVVIAKGTYLVDSEYVDIPEQTVLNLSRVPANVQCFSPHGAAGELVISEAVARIIRRASTASFKCVQAKCVGSTRKEMRLPSVKLAVTGVRTATGHVAPHPWLDGIEVDTYGKPWKETDVRAFERSVGVRTPQRIRGFLQTVGSCRINHQEVFGDSDVSATASRRRLAELVRHAREEWIHLPNEVVPIGEDGRGGYFAIDVRKEKSGDCPVVAIDHELNDPLKRSVTLPRVAASFAAWLKSLSY